MQSSLFIERKKGKTARNVAVIAGALVLLGIVVTAFGMRRNDSADGAAAATGAPNLDASQQVELATKFLETGEPDKALEALDQMAAQDKKGRLPEGAARLRLDALERMGLPDRLAKESDAFLEAFPNSKQKDEVELIALSARVATAGLKQPELLREVQDYVAKNPDRPGVARLQLALARHEIGIGDTSAARRRLLKALDDKSVPREVRQEVQEHLGQIHLVALFQGDSLTGSDGTYEVKSGDTVWKIARDHGLTQELLLAANGIDDPKRLRPGQTLRVPGVDFALHCNVAENELILTNHGQFFKRYQVRTGRVAGTTPQGDYKILNKKKDPTWRPGDGRVYGPKDPNNELGTRWMAFEGDILGIHGTIHPETVGHYASNGCIGLTQGDVEQLFDLVMEGTPLKIVGQQDATRFRIIPARDVPPPVGDREVASR